jgi:uncharacterized membrane protein YphA (DoxX/SURF4 family)
MKYIRIISRILLGLVFIFSGFVKGIDPMGGAIKFAEYFAVFHLSWLEPASLVLSLTLSIAEFMIGVSLLIGLRMKVTAWAALLFMGFFTVLTLYSAVANPVRDCGCFGDALKLTNWQTFYKNIVFLGIAVFIFFSKGKYLPYSRPFIEWMLVIFLAAASTRIFVYCYQHLPIMDFRPYSIGTNIPSKMITPPGSPKDEYEIIYYYEKNGVVKEFPVINNQFTPPEDTTWKYKDRKDKIIKEGYRPPIHDFSITNESGDDITNQVLTDTSYSFIFVAYDAEKINNTNWKKIEDYYSFALKNGHKFYILTSSPESVLSKIRQNYHLSVNFHYTDETTLKTMIRSNPGLILLKNGTVLGMWHYNDFPQTTYFIGNILSAILTDCNKSEEWKRITILSLGFLVLLLALLWRRNAL